MALRRQLDSYNAKKLTQTREASISRKASPRASFVTLLSRRAKNKHLQRLEGKPTDERVTLKYLPLSATTESTCFISKSFRSEPLARVTRCNLAKQ